MFWMLVTSSHLEELGDPEFWGHFFIRDCGSSGYGAVVATFDSGRLGELQRLPVRCGDPVMS